MRPFRVEAPQGALVPVEDLRQQLRVDTDEQDNLINAYERAAVDYLDGYTGRLGRCILRQKWALPLVGNPEAVFLPFPDCREFSVERLDSHGEWSNVAGVSVTHIGDHALLASLPIDQSGLHLTCWAGWEEVVDVPEVLKQAVRLLVAHWFDPDADKSARNVAPSGLPNSVAAMIQPFVSVFA